MISSIYKTMGEITLFRPLALLTCLRKRSHTPEGSDVHFVTYADDRHGVRGGKYAMNQSRLAKEAGRIRGVHVHSLGHLDLKECKEYQENSQYFEDHPYANGHAFKPVVIKKLIDAIPDGSILFYCDSFDYSVQLALPSLVSLCEFNGNGLAWEYGEMNAVWTARRVFEECECDSEDYWTAPQIGSTWFLIKLSPTSRQMIKEWARLNCIPSVAQERHLSNNYGKQNMGEHPAYKENRGDQSIFSLLYKRYGFRSCFGAGFGFNRNPNLFLASALVGSGLFVKYWKLRGRV